ncbi:MAG: ATP-binding protein [Lachnospiraceae bacterium]
MGFYRKPLPVGVDDFEKLVTRGYYFIDKTNIMRDLLDMKGDVNLFTRPRRFGKTLSMSMLQYFFEDMRDKDGARIDNTALFEGLNIMQAGEQYLSHMGQYPVINMTLKAGKRPTFESACTQIAWQIAMEYQRHDYVFDTLSDDDKRMYARIRGQNGSLDDYCGSLQFLSKCLEVYYGKKAIILIDEYDVPLENAYLRGFYQQMVDFIRSFFEAALKTNSSLEFAVVTGCLRISKESIFTGLNNLKTISILDEMYDEYFGFTDDEVRKMCEDYQLSDKYETFRSWYNGYIFGKANVYNPWSVIRFMDDVSLNHDWFPRSYWANTSSNSIVRKLIEKADDSVKGEIEHLIDGGSIEKPVHEDITYDEIYNTIDNMWNFMFFTGYFRKVDERMDANDVRWLTMRLPNREVRYIFREKVMTWFREKIQEKDLTNLYTAFVSKDTATLEDELNQIMFETISSMDENESYYHGLVAGLLSPMKGYRTKSNREAGKGRSDLFVKPVSRRKEAFVVEFKVAKRIKDLEKMADEALRQIAEKQYAADLFDDGYEIVGNYGIAFCGKDCLVKFGE